MPIFYGKHHAKQTTPIDLDIICALTVASRTSRLDNNWVMRDKYSSEQCSAITLSNQVSSSGILAKSLPTNICCIADAYISNKKELFLRLHINQEEALLWSEADLILACYQRWGIDCLNHLCGNFVFALWDPTSQNFFLVRDPMGTRTVFYHVTRGNEICFSNAINLLQNQTGISKKINAQKVASFLTLLIEDAEMTFYQDISKVPAGFYLHGTANKAPALKRYWGADRLLTDPLILNHSQDYYHYFRELFRDVVQSYIPETGSVGSHLSGGLDSSSVSAMAAHLLQTRRLATFGHIPFYPNDNPPMPRWSYTDQIYMEAFSKYHPNTDHYYIKTQAQEVAFSSQFQPWLDQPAINPTNMPWLMDCVLKAHELGIRTLLTGQAGNVTISWPTFPFVKPRWSLRGTLSTIKQTCLSKTQAYPWSSFSAVHSELAKATNLRYHYLKEDSKYESDDSRGYYFDNNMADYSATIQMPMRFLYHVDHFDPTLDRRIVEFCLRTPFHVFQEGNRSRLLVREGLRDMLPELICKRTERGMQSADWYMLFEQNKAQYHDYLQTWQHTAIADYLDIKQLIKLLATWDIDSVRKSQGRTYVNFVNQYQLKLLRGIETGLFLDGK